MENKKLHVCLVNYEYPTETSLGGISTYQKLLAEGLVKLGHKVTVIAGAKNENQDYYENGVHVVRTIKVFPYKTVNDAVSYREKLCAIIEKVNAIDKIDIIESPEISAELVYYLRNRSIPVLIKLHTSYTIWHEFNKGLHMYPEEIENKVYQWEAELLKNADKIICCSNLLKQMMPKYHDITLDRIEVVPNMADLENFYPLPNNHNSNKILYCGVVEKRKGAYILAKAIPLVLEKIPDAIFEFVGDNSKKEKNGLSVKENLLEVIPSKYHKNLEFVGQKSNIELNNYYNEARIGVIPSLFDNFPYVALEELTTELPIVASKNTGVSEMIEHDKSGFIYDETNYEELAELIIKLYQDDNKRLLLGKNGRQEVLNKYSSKLICNRMVDIYKEVIDEYSRKKRD